MSYRAAIVGYVAFRARAMSRPTRGRATLLALGALLLAGAFGGEAALGGLAHLFDVTQERWGHTLVHMLGPAFLVLAVIDAALPCAHVVAACCAGQREALTMPPCASPSPQP